MSQVNGRENPYQAPRAAVQLAEHGRRVGWKIYFWVATVSAASTLLFMWTLGSFQILDGLDFTFVGVALAGVFGYAYRRPIARPRLWKLWLPFQILWDATVELVFAPLGLAHVLGSAEPPSALATTLGYLFLAPFYIALYRYAFRSADLWMPKAPGEA